MTWLWVSLTMLYVTGQILSVTVLGQTGIASNFLASIVLKSQTGLTLENSHGFYPDAVIFVRDEQMRVKSVTGNVLQVQRAINDTEPSNYAISTPVQTEVVGVIERVTNFNVGDVTNIWGGFRFAAALPGMLATGLVRMISWDYSYLEGNMRYFKMIVLWPLSAMASLAMISLGLSTAGRIFGR